jgi:hypothetical protein
MTSTYTNGPATVETVQAGIRANVDPTGRLISMSVDPLGTHGVVLWKRD